MTDLWKPEIIKSEYRVEVYPAPILKSIYSFWPDEQKRDIEIAEQQIRRHVDNVSTYIRCDVVYRCPACRYEADSVEALKGCCEVSDD